MMQLRPIFDYEDLYEISDEGDIFAKRNSHKMKPFRLPKGYMVIRLSKNNKKKSFYVHRLVAQHFVSNPNNLPQVNHMDTNKKNNNYVNLEWMTNQQNRDHAVANSLHSKKLTAEQVREVRAKYVPKKKGITISLMREYNVTRSVIQGVIYGKYRRSVI